MKLELIKMANKIHKETPCHDTKRAIKEILIYAFHPKACVNRLRDKIAHVVSGEHLTK